MSALSLARCKLLLTLTVLLFYLFPCQGIEVAGRRQGKHKQRVWLKVLPSGLKILDERTGVSFPDSQIALSSVCCSPVAVAPSSGSLLVLK